MNCTVTLRWIPVLVLAQLGYLGLIQAQPKGQQRWVATWATAQTLIRPAPARPPATPAAAPAGPTTTPPPRRPRRARPRPRRRPPPAPPPPRRPSVRAGSTIRRSA